MPFEIRAVLDRSLVHLQRNEFGAAESLLSEALRVAPDSCDALHLFGQMRRVQRQFDEAERLYLRALAVEPNRPELHHHLGQLLVARDRPDEAREAFERAVRLRPTFAEAHADLGHLHARREVYASAEAAFREALRLRPDLVAARQGLSAALIALKRPKDAEAIIRAGPRDVRVTRARAGLEHNLAIALSEQGRHDEALAHFACAETLAPDLPTLHYNRANTLQSLGRLRDAETSYRAALQADPLDLKAHASLNLLLYRLNRGDFLESYDVALNAHPGQVGLPLEKARLLYQAERFEEALHAYEHASRLAPDNRDALTGIATTLTRAGKFLEATPIFERLVKQEQKNGPIRCNFANCLLQMGEWERARQQAQASLTADPHDQLGLAMLGLALRGLASSEEETLDDYERYVQVIELEPPAGFGTMAAFNAELDRYLETIHHDAREHLNQTSRGGTKTMGSLFGNGHTLVDLLRGRIDAAVNAYIAQMGVDPAHPLFGRRRHGFDYWGSWSTRLKDRGFHVNHVHPRGWISSAYYVSVPHAVDDPSAKQGWLKFGEPPFDIGPVGGARRFIAPVSGRLVLFPSYMWHGTVPFHSDDIRSTIAFDVVPT